MGKALDYRLSYSASSILVLFANYEPVIKLEKETSPSN